MLARRILLCSVIASATSCRPGATPTGPSATPGATTPPTWPPPEHGPCSGGMVPIDGGTFTLGMRGDEVEVASFCIDRTEVTVEAYRACTAAGACAPSMVSIFWPSIGDREQTKWSAECNGHFDDRGAHPANCVGWDEADAFCRARGVRLPTEAEWEWVARGGDAGNPYPWGNETPDATRLNACGSECQSTLAELGLKWQRLYDGDDGFPFTAPVGSFPAGEGSSGVTDLGGNVFEWTATAADDHPKAPSRYERAGQRIARGGGFRASSADYARVELRVAVPPTIRNTYGGFRCASAGPQHDG
ncbi:MAG: SUMF1/EgtB/PvdO family nonheme iron enzyme [Myxococcota bacterium]